MRYALSYDAMNVLIDAIEELSKQGELFKQGKSNTSIDIELQKILGDKNFHSSGLTGDISFDPHTHNRKPDIAALVKYVCDKNHKNCDVNGKRSINPKITHFWEIGQFDK